MKVLVIGNSTRSVVCSAQRAGYIVYAIDRFGDVDTGRCAEKYKFFNSLCEGKLKELAGSLGEVDAVVLGPGFEKLTFQNVLNNPVDVMERVSDKLEISKKLRSMGIPHPETEPADKAGGLGFPLMVKPRWGSGGVRNMLIKNCEEMELFLQRPDAREFVAQEFIKGLSSSASLIGTGDEALVIALNEQLIGVPWLTRLQFAYCGNITPFHTKFSSKMRTYAEQIALEFSLVGSNGVDFIQTETNLYVLEVNPRFQGSLDVLEISTGINVFDAHVKSFHGELPQIKEPTCFAAKAILFADKKCAVDGKISGRLIEYMNTGRAADIPKLNSVILPDEPITTLIEKGDSRQMVLEKVRSSSKYLKDITET